MKSISRNGSPNRLLVKAGRRLSAKANALLKKRMSSPGSHICDVCIDRGSVPEVQRACAESRPPSVRIVVYRICKKFLLANDQYKTLTSNTLNLPLLSLHSSVLTQSRALLYSSLSPISNKTSIVSTMKYPTPPSPLKLVPLRAIG